MLAHSQPVFIDPTTDEGFKRLFGDKINLINFLNIIFRGRKTITDFTYRDTERIGATEEIGKVIFDLVVQLITGEEIILGMQTSTQTNLKQRMLYYASKVISDTAPKGNRKSWAYAIPEVYTIVLMDDFHMPGGDHKTYFHDTCLFHKDSGELFCWKILILFGQQETFLTVAWVDNRKSISFMKDLDLFTLNLEGIYHSIKKNYLW